jgi:RNA polymerase sigma-70 factor (ECF subfamily)
VQDVFVKLVRALPSFSYDRQKRFRAWPRTVVLNCHRNQRRRPCAAFQGAEALAQLSAPNTLTDLDEGEYRRHLTQRALKLIRADFAPASWEAFWQCSVLGRPAAEVAAEAHKRDF